MQLRRETEGVVAHQATENKGLGNGSGERTWAMQSHLACCWAPSSRTVSQAEGQEPLWKGSICQNAKREEAAGFTGVICPVPWATFQVQHAVHEPSRRYKQWGLWGVRRSGRSGVTHVVKLDEHYCSCGQYGTKGIPCEHACALIAHRGLTPADFCDQRFLVQCFKQTYRGNVPLIPTGDLPDSEQCIEPAHLRKRGEGRTVGIRGG